MIWLPVVVSYPAICDSSCYMDDTLQALFLHYLSHHALYQRFQRAAALAAQHFAYNLLDSLGNGVNFNVNLFSDLLLAQNHHLPAMLDEHDAEFALFVIDGSESETRAVERHVAFR